MHNHDANLQNEIENQLVMVKAVIYNMQGGKYNVKQKLLEITKWNQHEFS